MCTVYQYTHVVDWSSVYFSRQEDKIHFLANQTPNAVKTNKSVTIISTTLSSLLITQHKTLQEIAAPQLQHETRYVPIQTGKNIYLLGGVNGVGFNIYTLSKDTGLPLHSRFNYSIF
jgi:hypothetical protein